MGQEASSHHIRFLANFWNRLRDTTANDKGRRKSWYSVYSLCSKTWCKGAADILDLHCRGSSCQPFWLCPGQGYPLHWETLGKSFLDLRIDCSRDTHVSMETTEAPRFVTACDWSRDGIWGFRHLVLCVGGPCFVPTILLALYRLLPTCWVQAGSLLGKCLEKYLSVKVCYPCNSIQKKGIFLYLFQIVLSKML